MAHTPIAGPLDDNDIESLIDSIFGPGSGDMLADQIQDPNERMSWLRNLITPASRFVGTALGSQFGLPGRIAGGKAGTAAGEWLTERATPDAPFSDFHAQQYEGSYEPEPTTNYVPGDPVPTPDMGTSLYEPSGGLDSFGFGQGDFTNAPNIGAGNTGQSRMWAGPAFMGVPGEATTEDEYRRGITGSRYPYSGLSPFSGASPLPESSGAPVAEGAGALPVEDLPAEEPKGRQFQGIEDYYTYGQVGSPSSGEALFFSPAVNPFSAEVTEGPSGEGPSGGLEQAAQERLDELTGGFGSARGGYQRGGEYDHWEQNDDVFDTTGLEVSARGRYVKGEGHGREDSIRARLSDGEYVIDAESVSLLGDGSGDAGARRLDEMRTNLRKHKGKNLTKGEFSHKAKTPENYMRNKQRLKRKSNYEHGGLHNVGGTSPASPVSPAVGGNA